jgi:hypothetical protein
MKIKKVSEIFESTNNSGPRENASPSDPPMMPRRTSDSEIKEKAKKWDQLKERIDKNLKHFLESADGGCLDGRSLDEYIEEESGVSELEHIALMVADSYGYVKYNEK